MTVESSIVVATAERARHANDMLPAPLMRESLSANSEVVSLPVLAFVLCWTVVLISSFSPPSLFPLHAIVSATSSRVDAGLACTLAGQHH